MDVGWRVIVEVHSHEEPVAFVYDGGPRGVFAVGLDVLPPVVSVASSGKVTDVDGGDGYVGSFVHAVPLASYGLFGPRPAVAKTEHKGFVPICPTQSDWALAFVAYFARIRYDRTARSSVQKSFELSKPVVGLGEYLPDWEVARPKG